MIENNLFKTVTDQDGKTHKCVTEMCLRDKKYIVTLEREVLKANESGVFIKCTKDDNDEVVRTIFESLRPAKSLDVIDEPVCSGFRFFKKRRR